MGRKPNALIGEFFDRGTKLEDSSNRYQHTCKCCGDKFPKGRIDSLTNHIVKHCPAISNADRQRAIQQLAERSQQTGASYLVALDLQQPESQDENASTLAPASQLLHPPTPLPDMSALETLAEVSRQQLDSNGQHVSAEPNPKKRKRPSAPKISQSQSQSQPQPQPQPEPQQETAPLPLPPIATEMLIHDPQLQSLDLGVVGGDAVVTDLASVLRGIDEFVQNHNIRTNGLAVVSAGPAQVSRMIPDQLALAASAATEIMPKAESDEEALRALTATHGNDAFNFGFPPVSDGPTMIDPQLRGSSSQVQHSGEMQIHLPPTRSMTLQPRPSSVNPNLPHAQYMHDFRLNGDPHKSKTRGRFTAVRRKEVQEVRRQGACIRCRMLKKPCSGGTPCSTCEHVESARLWKSPCMRARIADEFDLYSAGLFSIQAFHEMNKIKPTNISDQRVFKMEATHFLDPSITPAVLPIIQGVAAMQHDDGPVDSVADLQNIQLIQYHALNQESETISTLVDQYIKRATRATVEQEPSTLMRPTLAIGLELATSKPDLLLSRALELWVATQMLVDPNMAWRLSMVVNKPDGDVNERTFIDLGSTAPFSYQHLSHQLRGQLEKRCAHLTKSLMNDLERRLLQRGHAASSQFETFLTAVILLNCVEKMCWLFYIWSVMISHGNDVLSAAGVLDLLGPPPNVWLLENSPESYVGKGDLVASVVSMLLRMRAVPPATVVGTDGIIHFDARASAKSRENGQHHANEQQDGERNAIIAAWFESVALRVEDVVRARDLPGWSSMGDCRSWELKYVGRLLLADG